MRALALLSLLVLSLAGLWVSTEYAAAKLHYPPEIGLPWVVVGSWPVYPPWGWLFWSPMAESRAPTVFRDASGITTIGAIAGCAAAALAAARRKPSGPSRSHGSSRWATTTEMRRAGLLREGGVVLGQTGDAVFRHTVDAAGRKKTAFRKAGRLIRHDGPEHVFCFAPTRSGKRRRPGRADTPQLAAFGSRLRHQKRKLGAHRGLASPIQPRLALRADGPRFAPLQSAAGNPQRLERDA